MKKRQLIKLCTILLLAWTHNSFGGKISFGSKESTIYVGDGATFNISANFSNEGGKIKRDQTACLTGNPIVFHEGFVMRTGGGESMLTGTFEPDPSQPCKVILNGTPQNPNLFQAGAGTHIDFLEVSGDQNRLEGLPAFNNPIELSDANTTLTLAIQSVLNQNVALNGGTLILEDNLSLADGVVFTGTGTVKFNGRRLSIGGSDMVWTGSCYWSNAQDVDFRANVDLSGTWTFEGDCYLNGDSTILDLSNSGTLWIRPNSNLYITQLKIKGLGNQQGMGNIYFEDNTSRLHLRRAALELTTTYTINRGQVIAEVGSSKVVTRDNILWFVNPTPPKLLVQGVNLFYETRTFPDNNNIRPNRTGVGYPIIINGNGNILHYRSFQAFTSDSTEGGKLDQNKFLGDGGSGTTLTIIATDPEFDGRGWYIHFSRNPLDTSFNVLKLLAVEENVDGILKHIVLKDFSSRYLSFQPNSSLTFGDMTTIELGSDEDLSMTWTFEGECILDGKEKIISLKNGGGIDVRDNFAKWGKATSLLLKNVTIKGLSDHAIRCLDNTATITFQNVKMLLANSYSFTTGHFEIQQDVTVVSGGSGESVQFEYGTNGQASTIKSGGCLYLDRDVEFRYAPLSAHKNLIQFEDKHASLFLNGAQLFATTVGWELKKGTLILDYKNTVSNAATTLAQAIVFGDGTNASNDLNLEIMPGGSLEVVHGILKYNNVNG